MLLSPPPGSTSYHLWSTGPQDASRIITTMATLDHLTDEIESILYIAREVMGACAATMSH
jgi:hypothetical protein